MMSTNVWMPDHQAVHPIVAGPALIRRIRCEHLPLRTAWQLTLVAQDAIQSDVPAFTAQVDILALQQRFDPFVVEVLAHFFNLPFG